MIPSHESGVVLVTDSMRIRSEPDGREHGILGARKFLWSVNGRLALVRAGSVLHLNGVPAEQRLADLGIVGEPRDIWPEVAVDDEVQRIYAALSRFHTEANEWERAVFPDADMDEGPEPGPHLLAVGGNPGNAPMMARFTSINERWGEPGDIFAIGTWVHFLPQDVAVEMQLPAPETLAQGRELAVDWISRHLVSRYGDRSVEQFMREEQAIPHNAFPLNVLTITADDLTTETVTR
jgi:hypothetical protein